MLMLRVYFGGEIQYDRKGAKYSIRSRFSLMATGETGWHDVESEIYRQLGYHESEYNLKIFARVNVGTTNHRYYEIIEIVCEQTWRGIYDQSMLARTQYCYVDLYVELVPIVGSMQPQFSIDSVVPETQPERVYTEYGVSQAGPSIFEPYQTQPEPVHTQYSDSEAGPSQRQPYQTQQIPRRDIYLHPYPDVNELSQPTQADMGWAEYGNPASPWLDPPRAGDPNDEADDVPQSDDEDDADSCEDDADWDSELDAEGDVPANTPIPPRETRARGLTHPVVSFNDTSAFQEADVSFFGTTKHSHDPLAVGQEYSSKDALQFEINDYHIGENIEIVTTSSKKKSLIVNCKDARCKWRLYATSGFFSSKWEIRTVSGPHTCHADSQRTDHSNLTAKMIAAAIKEDIKEDVTKSIKSIKGVVRKAYKGVTPSYNKLWRGRELAIAQIFGTWEGSYNLLTPLLEAIKRSNPGTKYGVAHEPIGQDGKRLFKAAAWAFGPCIAAVPHLRPIISIDACFLSGRYRGRLLMACGYDAENQLLPLAFALVDEERFETWGWFMRWFRQEVVGNRFMCVVSDRHMAIKKVFTDNIGGWYEEGGECVHRLCSQHVAENLMRNIHNKKICEIFKILVKKKKPRRFQEFFELLQKRSPNAVKYLENVGKYKDTNTNEIPKPWKLYQYMDGGARWGVMTTNGSESLNNVFRYSRRLPVVALVDDTFYKCVHWFMERREKAMARIANREMWSARVEALLTKRTKKCLLMRSMPLGLHGEHEVRVFDESVLYKYHDGNFSYKRETFKYQVIISNENQVQCTCLKPQLTGIPCAHVLAVCRERKYNRDLFVHPLYSATKLAETWSGEFHGFGNQCEWPCYDGPTIIPDHNIIKKGRRRHNRAVMIMDEMEGRTVGHQARRSTSDRRATEASASRTARQPSRRSTSDINAAGTSSGYSRR